MLDSKCPSQQEGWSGELAWTHYGNIRAQDLIYLPKCLSILSSISQVKVASLGRFLWNRHRTIKQLVWGKTHKLQLMQNVAAWVILGTQTMAYVTFLLCKLHWVPVWFWVQFKVLVVIYKSHAWHMAMLPVELSSSHYIDLSYLVRQGRYYAVDPIRKTGGEKAGGGIFVTSTWYNRWNMKIIDSVLHSHLCPA